GAATLVAATAIGLGGADIAGVLHRTGHGGGSKAQAESIGEPDRSADPRPEALAAAPVTRALSDRGGFDSPRSEDDVGGAREFRGSGPRPAPRRVAGASDRGTTPAVLAGPNPSSSAAGEPTASSTSGNSAAEHPDGPGHLHPKQGPRGARHPGKAAAVSKG